MHANEKWRRRRGKLKQGPDAWEEDDKRVGRRRRTQKEQSCARAERLPSSAAYARGQHWDVDKGVLERHEQLQHALGSRVQHRVRAGEEDDLVLQQDCSGNGRGAKCARGLSGPGEVAAASGAGSTARQRTVQKDGDEVVGTQGPEQRGDLKASAKGEPSDERGQHAREAESASPETYGPIGQWKRRWWGKAHADSFLGRQENL